MKSGIYCIKNKCNGKSYIGQSIDLDSRKSGHMSRIKNYRHPNRHLNFASKLYHWSNFDFTILARVPEDKLDQEERFWIEYFKSNNQYFGYNIESGGSLGKKISDESKRLISISNKGKIVGLKARIAISKFNKNKTVTEDFKAKMLLINKGRKHSDEFKRIASIRQTGVIPSMETRAKMSASHKGNSRNLGRKATPETRAKMSASQKLRKASPSTKIKMSLSRKGIKVTWGKKISDGVKKLSVVQVLEIKKRLFNNDKQFLIARDYGVDQSTISHIKTGAVYNEDKYSQNFAG